LTKTYIIERTIKLPLMISRQLS